MYILGITLEWDTGMAVHCYLQPKWSGKVCGLCGNFDDIAKNDLTTREGTQASPIDFGKSQAYCEFCYLNTNSISLRVC